MTIKQQHEHDCFMCCAAMAANLSYEEALEKWGNHLSNRIAHSGVKSSSDTIQILEGIGLVQDESCTLFNAKKGDELQPLALVLPPNQRAILQVPSLNHNGRYHMVFWDGDTLHDPSLGNTYVTQNVNVGWVWSFKP